MSISFSSYYRIWNGMMEEFSSWGTGTEGMAHRIRGLTMTTAPTADLKAGGSGSALFLPGRMGTGSIKPETHSYCTELPTDSTSRLQWAKMGKESNTPVFAPGSNWTSKSNSKKYVWPLATADMSLRPRLCSEMKCFSEPLALHLTRNPMVGTFYHLSEPDLSTDQSTRLWDDPPVK